jgi:hypothetical protein
MKLAVLAALEQRVALRYTMPPMTSTETASYITHHIKLALLTELLDVTAAQKAELPWRRITTLTEMLRSAGRTGRDLDLGATESGHTAPNGSPASSSLLLVSTSPTWP